MKIYYAIIVLLACALTGNAQQRFTKEQLREDADAMYSTIIDVHPYMFSVISRQQFETELERLKASLQDSMTVFDFYRIFSPLVASLGDGHTELGIPVERMIDAGAGVFPYKMEIDKSDTTVVIGQGIGENGIARGTRLVSVNGVGVDALVRQAYSMLSGEAHHFKTEVLNVAFSMLLYFIIPADEFIVEGVYDGQKRTWTVEARPLGDYLTAFLAERNTRTPYSFNIEKKTNTGVLSLGSFGIYDDEGKNEYRQYLDSVFTELKEKDIHNLIIDIRHNGGGHESLVWDLFQYISPVPFQTKGPSIEKVSHTVKKAYKLPNEIGINVIGTEGLMELRDNPYRYSGSTYLLTDNWTFSSAADLAWAFQYFKMGTIVGEETGGLIVSYGNGFDTFLPNTGLTCTISWWQYYGYGASENQRHGVIPDITVPGTEALDKVLEILVNN